VDLFGTLPTTPKKLKKFIKGYWAKTDHDILQNVC
jgi:hypothetical protein